MSDVKHLDRMWWEYYAEQGHWPTDRSAVVREARTANGGKWPAQLTSGVMFYMGERITRAEFDAREVPHGAQ